MATFTIINMGIQEEEQKVNMLMQDVSRYGRYLLPVSNNPDGKMLMAQRMVGYKILKSSITIRDEQEYFEFSMGDKFMEAKTIGAYKFMNEEKNRYSPSYYKKVWNFINDNKLVHGIIVGVIGGFFARLLYDYVRELLFS